MTLVDVLVIALLSGTMLLTAALVYQGTMSSRPLLVVQGDVR